MFPHLGQTPSSAEEISPEGNIPQPQPFSVVSRPPRKQVSRACDHCRLRRVKCDNDRPCKNCLLRNLDCNTRGRHNDESRTLPQALREIERLRLRVEELEAQLREAQKWRDSHAAVIPTPSTSSASNSPVSTNQETTASIANKNHTNSASSLPRRNWDGVFISTTRSEQTSYYGPASSFYFMSRIGTYLSKSLQQSFHDEYMQPKGMNKTLRNPSGPDDVDVAEMASTRPADIPQPAMSRIQEEYFLNLFWESHHVSLPIIDEGAFRKLYDSLWQTSRPYRKPHALVDIVLALSMQYGWSFLFRGKSKPVKDDGHTVDHSISGRWYYRRGQSLLAADLESPTLMTVQCHIYSVVFLCCASFQNMSHVMLAMGIRTAQILGLHLEPPANMARSERELRKRIWWVLYTTETKTCMKLSRPFSVSRLDVTASLPSDDVEAASFFNSTLGSYDGHVTWLTYSLQVQKLTSLVADVYQSFHEKCAEILGRRGISTPYQDPQALEQCAEFLSSRLHVIQPWMDQVPSGLKLQRRGSGQPLSLDRAPLELDTTAPLWLQRQRVYLELIYHTLLTNLYRPFIVFAPSSSTYTPLAARHAAACASHAVAHTHVMHQVLRETDLMTGWQEFFLWQWNAMVNMVGFVLASPIHAATPYTRESIDRAIEVFEVFGSSFAVAASAAAVTRDLTDKADLLVERLREGIAVGSGCGEVHAEDAASDANGDGLGFLDQQNETGFSEFMDWALTVDSFNNFEDLFADATNSNDYWGIL